MKVPPALQELADCAAQALTDAGVAPDIAQFLGRQIAGRVARIWGGRRMRIPNGRWGRSPLDFAAREIRNLEIFAAFDGHNITTELMRVYGMHEVSISKALRQVREDIRAGRTPVPAPLRPAPRAPNRSRQIDVASRATPLRPGGSPAVPQHALQKRNRRPSRNRG